MSKVYITAQVKIIAEADSGLSVDDIMERIDINVTDDGKGIVDALESEVESYHCTDSK